MSLTRSALHSSPARVASAGAAAGTRWASQPASVSRRIGLGAERAEAGVEHDAVELGDTAGERTLAVLVPEEPGIEQPGPKDPLVAGDDRAAVSGRDVGDHHEARGEAPVRVLEHEILLVMAQRGHQHLLGQRHELLLDPAEQHDRPLHQPGELDQKRRILAHPQPLMGGQLGCRTGDRLAPIATVEHDPGAGELLPVVLEVADLERRRRQEAMAAGGGAGAQRPKRERHDRAVEQTQDAVQRPHPADGMFPPTHRLRPRKARQHGAEQRRKHVGGGLTGPPVTSDVEPPLGVVPLFERVVARAERSDEALERLRRRPDPRPALLDLDIGLAGRQAGYPQRQPARRRERGDLLMRQRRLGERLLGQPGEIRDGALLHARRDLLGQQLEQQLRHGR